MLRHVLFHCAAFCLIPALAAAQKSSPNSTMKVLYWFASRNSCNARWRRSRAASDWCSHQRDTAPKATGAHHQGHATAISTLPVRSRTLTASQGGVNRSNAPDGIANRDRFEARPASASGNTTRVIGFPHFTGFLTCRSGRR